MCQVKRKPSSSSSSSNLVTVRLHLRSSPFTHGPLSSPSLSALFPVQHSRKLLFLPPIVEQVGFVASKRVSVHISCEPTLSLLCLFFICKCPPPSTTHSSTQTKSTTYICLAKMLASRNVETRSIFSFVFNYDRVEPLSHLELILAACSLI